MPPISRLIPLEPPPVDRVLHVILSSGFAGSERYCVDLANRQAALGAEVHVAGRRGSPVASALSARVHFHPIGPLFRGFQLRRLVQSVSPDVCHGHLSAGCKLLSGMRRRPPAVATLHVGYKEHQHARLDGLICVNRRQIDRLQGYNGVVRTIPNWLPQIAVDYTRPDLRAELALRRDQFLIGCVGRLHRSKGADVLIRAFRCAMKGDAALVLIGDGPQRAELEWLAEGDPRIHFLGHRQDVHSCLRAFDLFVSPSREESFGLAILEAMSMGVPLISTNTEGPGEYLRHQPATLVEPGDIGDLAVALLRAQAQHRACPTTAPAYNLSAFDPERQVRSVLHFYSETLLGRREALALAEAAEPLQV